MRTCNFVSSRSWKPLKALFKQLFIVISCDLKHPIPEEGLEGKQLTSTRKSLKFASYTSPPSPQVIQHMEWWGRDSAYLSKNIAQSVLSSSISEGHSGGGDFGTLRVRVLNSGYPLNFNLVCPLSRVSENRPCPNQCHFTWLQLYPFVLKYVRPF